MKKIASFIKFLFLISVVSIGIFFSKSVFCSDKNEVKNNSQHKDYNLSPVIKKILPSVVRVITDFSNFYHGYCYDSSYQHKTDILSSSCTRFSKYNDHILKNLMSIKKVNPTIITNAQSSKLGSGIIIDSEKSYVITNYHVISHASKIVVSLTDGKEYEAKIIGKNRKFDLALLQLINAKDLPSIKISSSDNLNVGDPVFAIGSPYNLKNSVTLGIISYLERIVNSRSIFDNFIQTDAAINHGNSGGPLFNIKGELIGINTSMISSSVESGNIGLGFSIPSNSVIRFVKNILKYGKINFGRLGISVSTLSKSSIDELKLPLKKSAVVVNFVNKNSAAEISGIKVGDIIVSADNKDIEDSYSLRRILINYSADDTLALKIFRDDSYYDISLELKSYNPDSVYSGSLHYKLQGAVVSTYNREKLLKDIENKKIEKFYLPDVEGVRINRLLEKSFIKRAGLLKNDIIVEANMKPVKDIKTLKEALSTNENIIVLKIIRYNKLLFKII
ncbi:MAG: PDZ domain-containing protein [Buchnera aphidicola (Periphyllus acericola)]|uniref:trypsin-like peptidase domain-containing protein n=1 Tax=Buchnera aphidicola TaxID=9 RepID=UPI0030CBC864|nr:PDZ domain-containing protein [Buchnera aphidicola (Periphyllus acericola)]